MIARPQDARLKRAARAAIEAVGGIEAAGHATRKSKATAGRWHNRNDADLPTLDSALALDEIAVSQGRMPEITETMAGELGFALLRLPDAVAVEGDWIERVGALSGEVGEAVQAFCAAWADRKLTRQEIVFLREKVGDVIRAAVAMDALLQSAERGEG